MEPDFSGWATKANIKCTDGRTITPDAFKHMDGITVPLVYQHGHSSIDNVLGHVVLRHVANEGVRADGFFNDTPQGKNAKLMVLHKDLKALSIYANDLVEKNKIVMHGNIRETSLVLAGANRGAVIDHVNIRHSDGDVTELEEEAIISMGTDLTHGEDTDGDGGTSGQGDDAPGDATDQSVQEVWESLTPKQQDVVNFIVGKAVEDAAAGNTDGDGDEGDGSEGTDAEHSATTQPGEGNTQEGADPNMTSTSNVFERESATRPGSREILHGSINPDTGNKFAHVDTLFSKDEKKALFERAFKLGSLKEAFEEAVIAHGITPIDVLFPEYKALDNTPKFNSRRMEWVQPFLDGLSHSPFSRVKSIVADITMDEARALGYVKGNIKKEEWFSVSKRYTSPTTVYKKQQLDRDDIIDITDFDVVNWMKDEMSVMLKEEIARAILIGDGRPVEDPNNAGNPNPDKIADPGNASSGAGLRSIPAEHELYKTDVNVNLTSTPNYEALVEQVLGSMRFYKGTGMPTLYTTWQNITNMLLIKDTLNRRIYPTKADLAAAMNVADIVPVEVMESPSAPANLFGVIFNTADYNVGADKGGEVNLFDFFDIDYNQYKYLGETRISGALTTPKAAICVWTVPSNDVAVTPPIPTFNPATGVATIASQTGVVWKDGNGNTLTAGAQTAIAVDTSITLVATPASGYYFPTSGNQTAYWTFTRPNPDGANSNS